MLRRMLIYWAFGLLFYGCSKKQPVSSESPSQEHVPTVHFNHQVYPCANGKVKSDSVLVTVEGRSVIVWHYNLGANCVSHISAAFRNPSDSLIITETDSTGQEPVNSACLCFFPVGSRIDSLSTGKYLLVLYQRSTNFDGSWQNRRLVYKDNLTIR